MSAMILSVKVIFVEAEVQTRIGVSGTSIMLHARKRRIRNGLHLDEKLAPDKAIF